MENNINPWKTKTLFFTCLLTAMLLGIVLLSGEIYFRLFRPQSIVPRYVENSHYGVRKNIANVRGEMITPMYRHKFSTNSQGFRGIREYSLEKPSDTYRIIVLGDSIALGHGVEDNETFSAILEKRLARKQSAEVINMGVSGFGTAEELIQLKNLGLKYEPDLVVLAYYPNDPYNNVVSELFEIEDGKLLRDRTDYVPAAFIRDRLYKIPGYSFLSQHSHLINFIRFKFANYYIRKLGQEREMTIVKPKTFNNESIELTAALLNDIIAELGSHNIPLLILNIPIFSKESSDNFPETAIITNKNTYLIDVEKQIYKNQPTGNNYYGDGHIKPFAHKIIGEWLEDFIYDQNLI